MHRHSKDFRPDLPQVIVGMAVTRDGIPIRVWSWPGNTSDSALIRQVKDAMRDWCLSKVIWVADRGFASGENRRYLRQGGGSCIIDERLSSGSAEAQVALSRQGRYKDAAGNLKVKEVRIAEGERFSWRTGISAQHGAMPPCRSSGSCALRHGCGLYVASRVLVVANPVNGGICPDAGLEASD